MKLISNIFVLDKKGQKAWSPVGFSLMGHLEDLDFADDHALISETNI